MNSRILAVKLFIRHARKTIARKYPNYIEDFERFVKSHELPEVLNDQGFYNYYELVAERVGCAARDAYRWDGTRILSCEDRPGSAYGWAYVGQRVYHDRVLKKLRLEV